jgi:hypothetical protein
MRLFVGLIIDESVVVMGFTNMSTGLSRDATIKFLIAVLIDTSLPAHNAQIGKSVWAWCSLNNVRLNRGAVIWTGIFGQPWEPSWQATSVHARVRASDFTTLPGSRFLGVRAGPTRKASPIASGVAALTGIPVTFWCSSPRRPTTTLHLETIFWDAATDTLSPTFFWVGRRSLATSPAPIGF